MKHNKFRQKLRNVTFNVDDIEGKVSSIQVGDNCFVVHLEVWNTIDTKLGASITFDGIQKVDLRLIANAFLQLQSKL